jgi:radical SAM superfamily enzyme YgiQ (UPF0313 family)
MSQVVLFSPKFADEGKGKRDQFSYTRRALLPSIFRLATDLRLKGYSVRTIATWFCDFDTFKEIVVKYIDPIETKVIGLSTTLMFDMDARDPAERELLHVDTSNKLEFLKQYAPNAKIVIGGSLSNMLKRPSFKFADCFVAGQGEEVLSEIVNSLKTGTRLISESVAPTVYTDKTYPFKDFNTSYTEYQPEDFIDKSDCLGIEFARGCVFSCSYCDHDLLGKKPNEFIKSKNVLRDEFLRNYETNGTKYYYFTDNLLNEDVEKMEVLAEATANLPFKIQYSAYVRLDLIHKFPIMADLMRDSGMIGCSVGIETINDASGKSVKKGLGLERTNEGLEICQKSWKNNIALEGLFIIGLPHDTLDTVNELDEWLNTPLVKATMTNFVAQPLHIITKDILDNNDKMQYTWSNSQLPKVSSWTNRNGLTFDQAKKDCEYITNKFLEKYQLPISTITLNLPQVLAYAEAHNMYDEVKQVIVNRIPGNNIKSKEDWQKFSLHCYNHRSNIYMNKLLSK